jgi:chloramphenicol 3-O-phosphotransferase
MKKDLFQAYVENTRDCDAPLLDIAVNKGLRKAKSERIDYRKVFSFAAACAATAALCFTINTAPVREAALKMVYYHNPMSQEASEILYGYFIDISNIVSQYLGGGI